MLSFYRKYYKTVFDIALLVLTVYLFMLLFSYLYGIAKPIFFAFVIYLLIEPPARFLHRRGLKKSIATTLSTLLFVIVILGVITGAGAIFAAQIANLASKLPEYASVLQEQIWEKSSQLQNQFGALPQLPAEILTEANSALAKISSSATAWISSLIMGTIAAVTSFSTFIVNFVIGIILAYFLSIEIETWKRLASEKTPRTFKTAFFFLKENVLKGIVTYIKAQAKLISLTFIVIFVVLLILRVPNAFSISLLAAVFDVLPLLGVSTLFIPWIIYLLIVGQIKLAIYLAVLLLVVIAVRQIMEPKITGDSLGVSAFTMLAFMIVSLSLFGIAGLILSPILIILIKALYEQGYLKRWIRMPAEEYDQDRAVTADTKES